MTTAYVNAFCELMFGAGRTSDGFTGYGNVVFAFASAMMGFLVVLLDWVLFSLHGRSFLNMAYGGWKTIRLLALWALGAGLGGFLGASFGIFQVTRIACISVGVGWPLILPRLLADSGTDDETQNEDNGT